MVVGKIWHKVDNPEQHVAEGKFKRWCKHLYWHPSCYLAQGIDWVEKHPKPETRGRKRLGLADPVKKYRLSVMRRRAAVVQRIRAETEKPAEQQCTERLVHLGSMLNQLEVEMETCGGVPKSWA